ncbi:MAG TPA: glutathione S-transferase, partial [Rhizobacter sp.]|nr:glutathione S-transferase [Rhizobacter sp.]
RESLLMTNAHYTTLPQWPNAYPANVASATLKSLNEDFIVTELPLQLPNGHVLEESLDIMRWALEQHDPQGWLRLREQEEALALIALNDGPFKHALDRYKYASRHPERPMQAWRDDAVDLMLAPLNRRLVDRPFLLRDTPSLADMAIAPFIRQFAAVDPGWFDSAPFEPLQAWTKRIVHSTLFEAVMTKFVAWQPGDTEVTF